MITGTADLPLHYGKCPPWLFKKMKLLAREISRAIIMEHGKKEFLERISDPYFFQSFGCVLGFDWHSSGLTTTVCGALKEAGLQEYGIAVLGGKGKTSRKVPDELDNIAEKFGFSYSKTEELKKISKLVAKVDSSCLQDGFDLYHHTFVVDDKGNWAVIQQGMNEKIQYARRYHWMNSFSFNEPHKAICCDKKVKPLNLVDKDVEETRKTIVEIVRDKPTLLARYVKGSLFMPRDHYISKQDYKRIEEASKKQPENFEELLLSPLGKKSLRALALISNLIYGTKLSWKDPVKYSFAHGGKDKVPYPIDKRTYDKSIKTLKEALEMAELGKKEKLNALKRLANLF